MPPIKAKFVMPIGISLMALSSALAATNDVIPLSPSELSLQTTRWQGKRIEVDLHCLYADASDYRCVGKGVRITFRKISNPAGREKLEKGCRSMTDSVRLRCRFKIRFTYDGNRRTGGTGEFTVIDALNGEAEIVMTGRGGD